MAAVFKDTLRDACRRAVSMSYLAGLLSAYERALPRSVWGSLAGRMIRLLHIFGGMALRFFFLFGGCLFVDDYLGN
jgi:hypothetical protein